MRRANFLVILLSLVIPLVLARSGEGAELPERVRQSREAQAKFLEVHNFTNGRGIHLVPGIYKLLDIIQGPRIPVDLTGPIQHRLGFNVIDRKIQGVFGLNYEGMRVGVLGCASCHSGKAAGLFVPGLGNKRIDPGAIGKEIMLISKPYQWTRRLWPEKQRKLIDGAISFAAKLADPRTANDTQGLVPVRAISTWFYEVHGEVTPDDAPKGVVKVPHFWGIEKKQEVGLFADGMAEGSRIAWTATNELTAGQTVETIREIMPRFDMIEGLIRKFLPPPYPFGIERERARRGGEIFKKTCQGCHGTYEKDADGLPSFQAPRFIPWAAVGTDPDRMHASGAAFRDIVRRNPLSDLIKLSDHGEGYLAPRLEGIWARFPYLHNGSVPSLWDMLTPPASRPQYWSLHDAGERDRFDETRVGYTLPEEGSPMVQTLWEQAQEGARDVYYTGRHGHSNQGHTFGTGLAVEDKLDLIEYLKSL